MMQKFYKYIFIAAVFTLFSCDGGLQLPQGEGSLSMRVRIDAATRSQESADATPEDALVKIYKADFSGLVRSYTLSSMPSSVQLAVDSYRVDVHAGEGMSDNPVPASWDRKSYKGSAQFEIVADQETHVEVVAGVNNAVTEISFDQTIAASFNAGYTLTICLDEENPETQLVYDQSNSGEKGYFYITGLDEPSFKWTFTGVQAKHQREFVKTGVIKDLQPGKLYKMNVVYTVKEGDLDFSLQLNPETEDIDDSIVFDAVSTGLAAPNDYEIWACHATVRADIDASDSDGALVQFAISEDLMDWTVTDGVMESPGAWMADFDGLTPSTQYTYRLLIDDQPVGDDMTFTTDIARQLPNSSFEYVSKVSGSDYYKFYDPSCGVEGCTTKFWGSGNGDEESAGSASMGYTITEVDTGDKVHGKQSIKAVTKYAVVKLAAGNLFTGSFAGMVGTEGGKVNFGRPWDTRPSALKISCKYVTGKMDKIDGSPSDLKLTSDMYDRAQIKVAIGCWDNKKYGGTVQSPIMVNTTNKSTFVDFYTDGSTIANGDVVIYNDGYSINRGEKKSSNTGVWFEYEIPLVYRNLTTFPTHIVVSCASSQYGDYFSGSTSSKLWIDAVELIYR